MIPVEMSSGCEHTYGHVKNMDYARRHRIFRDVPKRFFSVCDRLGPDLFMKTLGVFLPDQTLFDCPTFQNGVHCPHPKNTKKQANLVF